MGNPDSITTGNQNGGISGHLRIFGWLLIINLIIINFLRASSLAITHDEALTYNRFASQGWKELLLSFHSNNHVLNTSLIKLSTSLFGLSHLTVRLPALFGGILYLIAGEVLCSKFCRTKSSYLITLGFLSINPMILDYMVSARGYSLALGFYLVGLCVYALVLLQNVKNRSHLENIGLVFSSISMGAAVAANLSFLFIVSSTIVVFAVFIILRSNSDGISGKAILYKVILASLPSVGAFVVLNPSIINFDRSTMYYGSQTWLEMYKSVLNAAFAGFHLNDKLPVPLNTILNPISISIFIAATVFLGIGYLVINRLGPAETTDNVPRLFLGVLLSIISLALLLYLSANLGFDLLLPKDRTGIFFIPLASLVLGMSMDTIIDSGIMRGLRMVIRFNSVLLILYLAFSNTPNCLRRWQYDCSSQRIFMRLQTLESIIDENGVGINWIFEPSLNFYRDYYHDNIIPKFSRREPNVNQNVFVLYPGKKEDDHQFIIDNKLKIFYRDPVTDVVICIK